MFCVELEKEAGYVGLTHRSIQQVTSIIANRAATLLSSGFALPSFAISSPVTPGGLSFLSAKSIRKLCHGRDGLFWPHGML